MAELGWVAKIHRSLHETWDVGPEARRPLGEQVALTIVTSAILNYAQISRKNDPPRLDARVSESRLRSLRPLPPGWAWPETSSAPGPYGFPISITDRSVTARLSKPRKASEPKCAEAFSATQRVANLATSAAGPVRHPPITARSQVTDILGCQKHKTPYRKILMFD
jgi:hypothetical protein